jgi:putative membrane protein
MMGSYGNGWGSGWMILMIVGWIAVIALGAWAVVALTRTTDAPHDDQETPRQMLDRRLAAGEIDTEEYLQKRRLLDTHSGSGPVHTAG